jgi:hypothetical protein
VVAGYAPNGHGANERRQRSSYGLPLPNLAVVGEVASDGDANLNAFVAALTQVLRYSAQAETVAILSLTNVQVA